MTKFSSSVEDKPRSIVYGRNKIILDLKTNVALLLLLEEGTMLGLLNFHDMICFWPWEGLEKLACCLSLITS